LKIHSLLNEGRIIPELVSQERDAALKEMIGYLKAADEITHDKGLFEKLIQREKLGSTAIGDGIAIPHCKLKEVKSPLLALAVSKKGVQFEALDGKPTHVFFLVVSSPDNPGQSLQILAAVAYLVRKAGSLQKRILGAKNPNKILEIIREEEEKIQE
jgi:mannitol/fructose-specific phosphotransferase system IIA component (Ntr-type)